MTSLICFNSIKVRLKVDFEESRQYISERFNSIKVRLKASRICINVQPFMLFQFHKGAIKSSTSTNFDINLGSFNSIKVRLKDTDYVMLVNENILFQFHKGAIKS